MLAALVGVWLAGRAPPDGPEPDEPDLARVAVLYFDDYSPGGQLEYLGNGLTEPLIHELSQVDALDVVSRSGVKSYHHASVPFDSIVRALRVGSVVEGSVTRGDRRLRVTVQLVDGRTGRHLPSRVPEQPSEDLCALQDSLAHEVAGFLRQALGREIRLQLSKSLTGGHARPRCGTRRPTRPAPPTWILGARTRRPVSRPVALRGGQARRSCGRVTWGHEQEVSAVLRQISCARYG